MQKYSTLSVCEQVDEIRHEVRRTGSSTVGWERLALLRPEICSLESRKRGLRQIGEWEGWAISPLENNRVRFNPLPTRFCVHGASLAQ
jgi:hypothetical protein